MHIICLIETCFNACIGNIGCAVCTNPELSTGTAAFNPTGECVFLTFCDNDTHASALRAIPIYTIFTAACDMYAVDTILTGSTLNARTRREIQRFLIMKITIHQEIPSADCIRAYFQRDSPGCLFDT